MARPWEEIPPTDQHLEGASVEPPTKSGGSCFIRTGIEPMRPVAVVLLCVTSAAVGAGIDHYWKDLSSLAGLDRGKPASSPQPKASEAKTSAPNPSMADRTKFSGIGSGAMCGIKN